MVQCVSWREANKIVLFPICYNSRVITLSLVINSLGTGHHKYSDDFIDIHSTCSAGVAVRVYFIFLLYEHAIVYMRMREARWTRSLRLYSHSLSTPFSSFSQTFAFVFFVLYYIACKSERMRSFIHELLQLERLYKTLASTIALLRAHFNVQGLYLCFYFDEWLFDFKRREEIIFVIVIFQYELKLIPIYWMCFHSIDIYNDENFIRF